MAEILALTNHSICSHHFPSSLLLSGALWLVLANEMEMEVPCVISVAKALQVFSCLPSPDMVNEETMYFRKFSYKTVESQTAQSLLVFLELSLIKLFGMSR